MFGLQGDELKSAGSGLGLKAVFCPLLALLFQSSVKMLSS